MHWQLYLILYIFSSSLSNIVKRFQLKEVSCDSYAYAVIFQLISGIAVLLFAFINNSLTFGNFVNVLPLFIFVMILYVVGNIINFKGLKSLEASESDMLFSSRIFWSVLFAVIIIGENFTLLSIIGTLLIIFGIVVLKWQGNSISLGTPQKLVLIAAVFFGAALTLSTILIKEIGLYSYVGASLIVPALIMLIIQPKKVNHFKHFFSWRSLVVIVLASVLFAIAILAQFLAIQASNNISLVTPLAQFSIVLTAFFGFVFLKERGNIRNKVIGVVIIVVGAIILKL